MKKILTITLLFLSTNLFCDEPEIIDSGNPFWANSKEECENDFESTVVADNNCTKFPKTTGQKQPGQVCCLTNYDAGVEEMD